MTLFYTVVCRYFRILLMFKKLWQIMLAYHELSFPRLFLISVLHTFCVAFLQNAFVPCEPHSFGAIAHYYDNLLFVHHTSCDVVLQNAFVLYEIHAVSVESLQK